MQKAALFSFWSLLCFFCKRQLTSWCYWIRMAVSTNIWLFSLSNSHSQKPMNKNSCIRIFFFHIFFLSIFLTFLSDNLGRRINIIFTLTFDPLAENWLINPLVFVSRNIAWPDRFQKCLYLFIFSVWLAPPALSITQ